MKAINITKRSIVAEKVTIARNYWCRLKGWVGRSSLSADEGLLIRRCSAIHTLHMATPVDLVFVDKRYVVVDTVSRLVPNRIALRRHASAVLELPAGKVAESDTKPGDRLLLCTRR